MHVGIVGVEVRRTFGVRRSIVSVSSRETAAFGAGALFYSTDRVSDGVGLANGGGATPSCTRKCVTSNMSRCTAILLLSKMEDGD